MQGVRSAFTVLVPGIPVKYARKTLYGDLTAFCGKVVAIVLLAAKSHLNQSGRLRDRVPLAAVWSRYVGSCRGTAVVDPI